MRREIYFWVLLIVAIASAALYFRYFYQQQISMELAMNGSGAGLVSYPYQNARLPIRVYNSGSGPITNMSVGLFVNGNLTTLYKVTLPAGKQTTIPFNYTPSRPGVYSISAVADPGKLYDIVDRGNATSGAVLDIMAPENATPYLLVPSNGLVSREDMNLSRSGYAVGAYLYDTYNASEFAMIDTPAIRNFVEPVLNVTANYIGRIYVSSARYADKDRAYSIWMSSYLNPDIFGMAANALGLKVSNAISQNFGNVTFIQISNSSSFCSWYSGGWIKILAYNGSRTCYQAINATGAGALNGSLPSPLRSSLGLVGGSSLVNYTGASGGTGYEAELSMLGNSSFVYTRISNHTLVDSTCYGVTETVNGIDYCSKYLIPASGKIGGASSLIRTTAYVGTHNLTAISLFNSSLLSYQVQTNIGIIRSFNISGSSTAFQSGLVNTCSFNDSFPCTDVSFRNGTLSLSLENGLGRSVRLDDLSCYASVTLNPNSTALGQQVAAGGSYNATVPCRDYLGRKISGVALNLNLDLVLNYTAANVTHTLPGKAYILLGST